MIEPIMISKDGFVGINTLQKKKRVLVDDAAAPNVLVLQKCQTLIVKICQKLGFRRGISERLLGTEAHP